MGTTVETPSGVRDLSLVPFELIDSDAGLSALDVLGAATLVALDTETVFDPENPTDLDKDGPGDWRVLSLAAKLPDSSTRSFVVDMGYVSAAAVQQKLTELALVRLRRAAADDVVLPASVLEVLELGDLDAAAALVAASGQLAFDLAEARHAAGIEAAVWNANFDRLVLSRDGVDAWFLRDAMLYRAVLDLGKAGVRFYSGLARAARDMLGVELGGKGSTQLSYREVELQPVLSEEQIRYAAFDAVVTLELFDRLSDAVASAGLAETTELEVRAQEFISSLTLKGLPLDVDGWREHLSATERSKAAVEVRLVELTGAQTDLFGDVSLGWSPSKDADIRKVLNEHATGLVEAYFSRKEKSKRLLGSTDSADKTALSQIGGELADTILQWKKLEKVRSTYGDELVEMADEHGRLHPKYLQAVVATGRLASSRPNAQNLSPQMKPFIRPPDGRVFVYADLGQAELRMLAQVSQDEVLRQAFRDGMDIHTRTAEGMFKVDVAGLIGASAMDDAALSSVASELVSRGLLRLEGGDASGDLEVAGVRYSRESLVGQLSKYGSGLRARGKTLNFGVCYGLRANSLATQLSVAGVPTSAPEANELLSLYDLAYPGIASWLKARDEFVGQLAANPPSIDFGRSLALLDWRPRVLKAERQLTKSLGRRPDADEIAEVIASRSELAGQVEASFDGPVDERELTVKVEEAFARRCRWIDEVRSFLSPVLLGADGSPFAFESRTPGGRRRMFNIHASAWVREMAMVAARSQKPGPLALRHRFEAEHNVKLSDGKNPRRTVAFGDLRKRMTESVARSYFELIVAEMPDAVPYLYMAGVKEAVKALGNQYRNAPIQGGVADAALWAYAEIQRHLDAFFPSAHGVQTVHDSITIECDRGDALAIGAMLKQVMEQGLARYTPDVPAVADMSILSCLDEKVGSIDPSELGV